jgi:hypothetical protein
VAPLTFNSALALILTGVVLIALIIVEIRDGDRHE